MFSCSYISKKRIINKIQYTKYADICVFDNEYNENNYYKDFLL